MKLPKMRATGSCPRKSESRREFPPLTSRSSKSGATSPTLGATASTCSCCTLNICHFRKMLSMIFPYFPATICIGALVNNICPMVSCGLTRIKLQLCVLSPAVTFDIRRQTRNRPALSYQLSSSIIGIEQEYLKRQTGLMGKEKVIMPKKARYIYEVKIALDPQ